MLDIQPDRFVRINPDIMEALAKIRIPGEARQVLDFIIRKTWGWQKKEDRIALSQFALGTNLKKPNVLRALSKLITMNLVIIKKDNAIGHTYRFNKDFQNWKPLSKKITSRKPLSKKIITVIQKDNLPLSKKIPTKETNTKETNTKESIKKKIIKKKKVFLPPSIQEVKDYIATRNSGVNAKSFFDFYDVANWFDSKGAKVRNWKQKLIQWEEHSPNQTQGVQYGRSKKSVGEDKYKGIGTEIKD